MADITKCEGINCDKRLTCYRFIANENPYRQPYFAEMPLKDDGTCNEYVLLLGASEWTGQVREE